MANANDFTLRFQNDKQALQLFDELAVDVQNKIILAGIRSAAKIILDKAKSNWGARNKGKSKSEGNFYSKFKIQSLNKRSENFGVKLGITNANGGYKLRWSEWGTDDRSYIAKKNFVLNNIFIKKGSTVNTGKMVATHFFYDAVDSTKEQAQNEMEEAIYKSYNRTIKRLSK